MVGDRLGGGRDGVPTTLVGASHMPPARPQQMSDPADKSDDLIAELAKLMASSAHGRRKPSSSRFQQARAARPEASDPAPAPDPYSRHGHRAPGSSARPGADAAPEPPRAPATGTIRIPGMDQPAPVSTSAPVAKFDFGTKPPIAPEPISRSRCRRCADDLPSAAAEAGADRRRSRVVQAVADSPVRLQAGQREPLVRRRARAGPLPPRRASPRQPAPLGRCRAERLQFRFRLRWHISRGQQKPANDPIADLIAAELDIARADRGRRRSRQPARPSRTETVVPVDADQLSRRLSVHQANVAPMPATPRVRRQRADSAQAGQRRAAAAENDRFAISPGIGLNGRPAGSRNRLGAPALRQEPPEPVRRLRSDGRDREPDRRGRARRTRTRPGEGTAAPRRSSRRQVHGRAGRRSCRR